MSHSPSDKQSRENFERYAAEQGCKDFERNEFEGYKNHHTELRWTFWRAALLSARSHVGTSDSEARRLAILECAQMVNGRLAGRQEGSDLWLEIIKITNMLARHAGSEWRSTPSSTAAPACRPATLAEALSVLKAIHPLSPAEQRDIDEAIRCIVSFDGITEAMVDTALEAAKGAMVDTRRHWTEGDRATVRAMLEAVIEASKPSATALRMPPMDEHLLNILGRPGFGLSAVFQLLRFEGYAIPTHAEEEQAWALHWLLGLYFEHGAKWLDAANDKLKEVNERRLARVAEAARLSDGRRACSCGAEVRQYHRTGCGYEGVFNG